MVSVIAGWVEFVIVDIIWNVLHSRSTVVLHFETGLLQSTLCGIYCTAGWHSCCTLNGIIFSEHYCKTLHTICTVLFQLELNLLWGTLCGSYCIAIGNSYCNLNGLLYSKLYLEITSHHLDICTAVWIQRVTFNIILKIFDHISWTDITHLHWYFLLSFLRYNVD